jgi:hypothetical protein
MFTIKFYSTGRNSPDGYRQVIKEAESFTILRGDDGTAEITMHHPNGDFRLDVNDAPAPDGYVDRFESAIIENASGKTTEMIALRHGRPTAS